MTEQRVAIAWDRDIATEALGDHPVPPPGLDFARASRRDRLRYGSPTEPNPETQPHLWAKWNRNLARPWRRVVPDYDLQPARSVRRGRPTAGATSGNWSGAVLLESGGHAFSTITGTWIVPDAYPPASDWSGAGWSDGYWNALHWIGIDGWSGTGANNVMQVGTGTDVSVQNGNVTVSCYAWLEWWYSVTNNGFATINKFTVSPGDLIEATVCGVPGTDDTGVALIANVTRQEYMSQAITPPSPTVSLEGTSAEWIVEREGFTGGGLATLADYGAMFFTDCRAGWSIAPSSELDLSGATFVDMTDGASTVSTALQVSDNVLECYYGTVQP